VIEHVPDPAGFCRTVAGLLVPGGVAVLSTLNRTAKAWGLAVVGAEYLLGWLPRGTHDWRRFLSPDELAGHLSAAGLVPVDRRGMVYDPLARGWRLSARDLDVNHLATAVAPKEDTP
jgi:2-polyprenyl-6-hydroxyphenyl methylase/3-demethylubiquinone-9 3-methyltransferase